MSFPKPYNFTPVYKDVHGGSSLYAAEIKDQNIVKKLIGREIWGNYKRPGTEKYVERSMYQSILPNFTITHVDKPPCFLRKFTPDGKYFIAFSSDQMFVEVYGFNGPEAATHLFSSASSASSNSESQSSSSRSSNLQEVPDSSISPSPSPSPPRKRRKTSSSSKHDKVKTVKPKPLWTDVITSDHTHPRSLSIRKDIFSTFFTLKYRILVASQGEQLNRECSLFSSDSRYLIVGSATYIQDELYHPSMHEIYRNNESVEPNGRYPLEDYSIHLIDLKYGRLSDTITFKVDKIYLSHNQGIYLYNNQLAILSVQHQTIHLYHLNAEDGELTQIKSIGRFCYEDDELVIPPIFRNRTSTDDPFYSSLKHRLLVYVYKKAHLSNQPADLVRFYQYFPLLKGLKIWKMQLLDEDTLLLKYSTSEVVTLKVSEPNSQYCLFVIYSISKTEIFGVYENHSEELVDLFEGFCDNFRNNCQIPELRYSSSPSNNFYSKQIHTKFRQTITSARFGGPIEATKRILAQLPISAQSFSASPYLDQALFSYDDHRVSVMERPKACGELPIRFYGRDSGIYKFQIHAGILPRGSTNSGRRLVAFTFHPTAPFAISVQRANAEYLVNLHIRMDPTVFISK